MPDKDPFSGKPADTEANPYPDDKMGNRLREQGAKVVKEHDRKMTDDTGRVHHSGPGK